MRSNSRHNAVLGWFCRLNKIGINPNIVTHHEEEEEDEDASDSKTINAVVNALSEQAEHANTSMESEGSRSVLTEIGRSLHMLTASLPRPKSECNFNTILEHQAILPWTPFHRSDTIPNNDQAENTSQTFHDSLSNNAEKQSPSWSAVPKDNN